MTSIQSPTLLPGFAATRIDEGTNEIQRLMIALSCVWVRTAIWV